MDHDHHSGSHCHSSKKRFDFLLWGSLAVILPSYLYAFYSDAVFSESVYELVNRMWWGVLLGISFVGLLSKIPREMVSSVLGKGDSFGGIVRATFAGLLMDLCSHGILLVGMKLYERGASLGQVMAFLIASPWNSLSLTLILWSLVGLKWMLTFLLLSLLIALISGLIFNLLTKRSVLPPNPNSTDIPEDFALWPEIKTGLASTHFNFALFKDMIKNGAMDSRMILRWVFLGVVLASAIRTFIPAESFETYFGATLAGLGMTIIVATILEVCSEGSVPIAADILTRAHAPGNSFAFLMTGVSTDYTEIMGLRETTKSWKIALFLPLVTVPQVLVLAWMLNG